MNLWPMAMQHTSYLLNTIPNVNEGLSPEEKFSCALHGTNRLTQLPVWGCPVYVLQPKLQDQRKIPKWEPRSRRGQYQGWSPLHASNVALVRNLKTGYISPQFHVIFDNWFETVGVDDDVTPPAVWDVLVTHSHFRSNVDDSDLDGLELDDEWLSTDELIVRRNLHARSRSERPPGSRDSPQSSESPTSSGPSDGPSVSLDPFSPVPESSRSPSSSSEGVSPVSEGAPLSVPSPSVLPSRSSASVDRVVSHPSSPSGPR